MTRQTHAVPTAGVDRLGARLREARMQVGMSVRGLARKVDVSPSLISQIENAHVMPSVGTLYAIVNELGLFVDDLFRDGETTSLPQRRLATKPGPGVVQRSRDRNTIRLSGGVRWERLTPTNDPEVEFLYVVYEVGAKSSDEDSLIRHGGMEYAYLLSGRLGIQVGLDEFKLGPGDAITFDAQNPHRLWTIGDRPAIAIWVVFNRHSDRRRPKST